MSNGEIKDFDKPTALLDNKNSILYKLVKKQGKDEFQKLYAIAQAHNETSSLESNSHKLKTQ